MRLRKNVCLFVWAEQKPAPLASTIPEKLQKNNRSQAQKQTTRCVLQAIVSERVTADDDVCCYVCVSFDKEDVDARRPCLLFLRVCVCVYLRV